MKYLFIIFVFIISCNISFGQTQGILNKLLAPGPLIIGHKDLEGSQCLKCHETGEGVPDSKCLECHKEIKAFVAKKSGFHGNQKDNCIKCHSDHKDRKFDSTLVDEKKFDHSVTKYILAGKHKNIHCIECHKTTRGENRVRPLDKKYVGATTSCTSCHKKHDIHFYKNEWAKKDCNACHGLETWKKDITFNHKTDAKFDLIGKHKEISCKLCHNPDKKNPSVSIYKWPTLEKTKCLSCHTDFHKENLNPKYRTGDCTTCHLQTTWKLEKFNHEVTGYVLKGKHLEKQCLDCHKQKVPNLEKAKIVWSGLKAECITCHADIHRYGTAKPNINMTLSKCATCHDETSWKTIHDFNHNAHTRYNIDGAHKELKCAQCHLEIKKQPIDKNLFGIYQWPNLLNKTCENCHNNPHLKTFDKKLLEQKCTVCHVTEGWKVVKGSKDFSHATTRFPLTGKHIKTTCTQCHVKDKKQIFKWESKDKGFCIECHENVHKTQFSAKQNVKSCNECHQTESFKKRLEFDHNTATNFPINGAHKKQDCKACHQLTNQVFPFKPITQMSQFQYPNFSKNNCLACHQDVHKGQLGSACLSCHNEDSWTKIRFNHQTQSKFPLKGKHETTKCIKCHKPIPNEFVTEYKKQKQVIRFKLPGFQVCTTCHADYHKGTMGQSCSSCHNEKSWKTTKDFHQNFSLTGVHFTLQCTECHMQNRKLSGLSQECAFCHKKDDIHSGTLPRCSECHRQQFWEITKFNHSLTTFPLRGAHRTIQCQECHSRGIYQGLSSACVSCHLKDAQGAISRPHTPIASFTDCTQCHKHQFSFK